MRYQLRYMSGGRIHYAASDFYSTLVMLGQALYDCAGPDVGEIEIWQGSTCLWRDNHPLVFSA